MWAPPHPRGGVLAKEQFLWVLKFESIPDLQSGSDLKSPFILARTSLKSSCPSRIHMYPGGADRNTFGFMYHGCIGCVLCMMYSTYVLQMYLHMYPERQLQIHAEYI